MKFTHALLAVTLIAALLCPHLRAQDVPPALMVKGEKQSEPLGVRAVAVEVRIVGQLAETKMTMTFANPHRQALAGDLYFPLPEGSTVTGYALDIDGRMVPGVSVEKSRGRQVFESIARQGIDPGLVEWVKGNNFKTRVFPIPAGGTRTVRVEYVSQLHPDDQGTSYRLPLNFKEKVARFSLHVSVIGASADPAQTAGPDLGLKFERGPDGGRNAAGAVADQAIDKALVLNIPGGGQPGVIVEKAPDGQCYFVIHDAVSRKADQVEQRKAPARVVVLWDASASRGESDHARELKLLRAWFARFKGAEVAVNLWVFRNAMDDAQTFTVRGGDAGKLIEAIGAIHYDGGTQLSTIASLKHQAPDAYLLFTDGLHTFGREGTPNFGAPLYVFADSPQANHVLLRHLAAGSGGQYFNLNRLADDQAVIDAIGRQPFSFLRAETTPADAKQLYPRVATPLGDGTFTLVGQLTGEAAKVTLHYGAGGQASTERTFELKRSDAVEGNLVSRFWAMRKVDELSILPEQNQEDIVNIGQRFNLVTPHTSLIVLERLEQYLEHGITPPPEMGQVRDQFEKAMADRQVVEQKARSKQVEEVLAMWNDRIAWWQKEFKYPKDFKYQAPEEKVAAVNAPAGSDGAPRPAAEPQAAPPAEAREMDGVVMDLADAAGGEGGGGGGGRGESATFAPGAIAGKDGEAGRPVQPGVAIKPWDPKTPYLADLRAAKPAQRFEVYLHHRKEYGKSPAFYLDCADYFFNVKQSDLALQVLSNIAELELENAALLRVLGHRLAQFGQLDLAVATFEQVKQMRPEEPQSWRDLALVLGRRAERDKVASDYQRACELLAHVVMNKWDRFEGIEVIALTELNRLWAKFGRELPNAAGEPPIDKRLIKLLDMDVRIIMTWDADLTDMDLWVTEPSGEKCFYSHNRTTIGGHMSRDFTQGYGPEEYFLRKAMTGTCKVQANYYGSRSVEMLGQVTLQLDVFTNYGRPNEQHKSVSIRLKEAKDTVDVAELEF